MNIQELTSSDIYDKFLMDVYEMNHVEFIESHWNQVHNIPSIMMNFANWIKQS